METDVSIKRLGSRYHITWPNGVEAHVSRIRENPERIKCEVAITLDGKLLTRSSPVLTSESGKDSLIRKLQRRRPKEDWGIDHEVLIEQLAAMVIDAHREGAEPLKLAEVPEDNSLLWRIEGILPEGQPSLLYGDGGSGKSMVACWLAVMVDQGYNDTELKIVTEPGRVLMLDWETDEYEIAKRVRGLMRGWNLKGKTGIGYRRCTQPLIAEIDRVMDICDEYDISFIVCDSLGLASGGALEEADATLQFFNALRMLGRTTLVISHINKAGQNFGSVYANNSSRMSWAQEGSRSDSGDGLDLAMFHRKANTVAQQAPRGWHIHFGDDGTIRFETRDVYDTQFAGSLTTPQLVYKIISNDGPVSRDQIKEKVAHEKNKKLTDIEGAVNSAVSRMKQNNKIVEDNTGLHLVTSDPIPINAAPFVPGDRVEIEI